jgi:very-short-patch-repair endonuclease
MTDGERRLWSELRQFRRWYGIHVRKQAPIGPYVVDFVVQEHRLMIEVDGEHHFTAGGLARDARRDAWLAGVGYRVLRFNTGELVDAFDGCIEEILGVLGLAASPPPLTQPGRATRLARPSAPLEGEGDSAALARSSAVGVESGGIPTSAISGKDGPA